MKKLIIFLMLFFDALFLTNIVDLYTINTVLQYIFVFIYFFVISIGVYFLFKKILINNANSNRKLWLNFTISFVLGLMCVSALFPKVANVYHPLTLEITATGTKNVESKSSEVWILGINTDGKELNFTNDMMRNGWELKSGALVSYKKQPATLKISLPVKQITLNFLEHDWSGKVSVKVGNKIKIIDLYSNHGNNYEYNVTNNLGYNFSFEIILQLFSAIIFFMCLIYLLLQLVFLREEFFILLYLYIFFIIFQSSNIFQLNSSVYPNTFISKVEDILLLFMNIIVGLLFSNFVRKKSLKLFLKNKKRKTIFTFISLSASFFVLCNKIFFKTGVLSVSLLDIAIFILFLLWLIPIELVFLGLIDFIRNNVERKKMQNFGSVKRSHSRLGISLCAILILIWGLYLIGLNPGNMSPDSIDQWAQAHGYSPISDVHPAFHTILISWLIKIYDSPIIVSVFQILFFSYVLSSFLIILCKQGISKIWVIFLTVIFALIPTNGVYVTTLWKDVPYTISLLWLTTILVKLNLKLNNNYKANIFTLIELILSLSFVFIFRQNGFVPYILTAIGLIYYGFKYREKIAFWGILGSVLLICIIKGPLYNSYNVIQNPSGQKFVAPIHGIARVIDYDGSLSPNTTNFMESIMNIPEWKRLYSQYTADTYLFGNDYQFVNKLSSHNTSEIIKLYLDALIRNPSTVIYDRLSGSDLLWDITQPSNGYNNRFDSLVIDNQYGIKRKNNFLTDKIRNYLSNSTKINFIDIFIWRSGIYLVGSLLLLFYNFCKNRRISSIVFIPLIGNIISLFIAMAWQDYRYVYYMFVLFWPLLFFTFIDSSYNKTD